MPAKKLKRSRRAEQLFLEKRSKGAESSRGYLHKYPSWAFSLCDEEHPRWALCRIPSLYHEVVSKLRSFEGMTWAEIQSASGGRSHGTNSHFEPVSELSKEARDRADAIHLQEEYLFSLWLDGRTRLFGIIEDGVFYIIWHDPLHEIYPVGT